MATNKNYIQHGIKWGAIMLLVTSTIHYALYFTNMKATLTFKWLFILILLNIVLLAITGISARKIGAGVLSFKNAFISLVIAIAVSSFVSTTADFIIKSAKPSLAEQEKAYTIENSVEWMESFGTSEAEIDNAITKMEEQDATPSIGKSVSRFIWGTIFMSVFALIIAAIVKKKPKETIPQTTE